MSRAGVVLSVITVLFALLIYGMIVAVWVHERRQRERERRARLRRFDDDPTEV